MRRERVGTPPKRPNPNLPGPPPPRDDQAVQKVVASVDDDELIPAAAKGTDVAGNFTGAQELGRYIADQLAAAEASRKDTVVVPISEDYRHAKDLQEIFVRIEAIVRQIAAVLPGGVRDVEKVIIEAGAMGKDRKYPPRWVVKIHDGS